MDLFTPVYLSPLFPTSAAAFVTVALALVFTAIWRHR